MHREDDVFVLACFQRAKIPISLTTQCEDTKPCSCQTASPFTILLSSLTTCLHLPAPGPVLPCIQHERAWFCAASVLAFHQLPPKELVLLHHSVPVFVKAWCFLWVSWINRHVQAITEPWRCRIQLGTDCRALAHKVIKREHFSSQCYCRMAAGRKGRCIQLQHSQLAPPQKNPVLDPLLHRRKTLLCEGCIKNTKTSSALRLSSRFGPQDLLLLLPVFTCMLGLWKELRLRCAAWKD